MEADNDIEFIVQDSCGCAEDGVEEFGSSVSCPSCFNNEGIWALGEYKGGVVEIYCRACSRIDYIKLG